MKKIDKQLLSALAIGVGAGIVFSPVTVYADEGEPDPYQGDGNGQNENIDENKDTESSAAQEADEAAQSISDAGTAIDTAQTAIADTGADNQSNYTSANNALNIAESEVGGAQTDLAKAQDAAHAANNDITIAGQQDSIMEEKASEASGEYADSKSDSQAAIDLVDGIDVETTSIDDAKTAASQAQDDVLEAERKAGEADTVLSDAEAAASQAQDALSDITTQSNKYNTELGYAEAELKRAEDTLSAAKEEVQAAQTAKENALSALDEHIGKQIKELHEAIAGMESDDPNLQAKVDELGKLVAENLFLEDKDKEAYANGEFTFRYELYNGKYVKITKVTTEVVQNEITIEGAPEGYYSIDDERFIEYNYSGYASNKTEEEDAIYAYSGSTPAFEYDHTPVDGSIADGENEWKTYELIPGQSITRSTYETISEDGQDVDYVKVTRMESYNITSYKKVVVVRESSHYGQEQYEIGLIVDNIDNYFTGPDYEGYVVSNYTTEDYSYRPDDENAMFGCRLIVTLRTETPTGECISVKEEFYNAKRFEKREAIQDETEIQDVTIEHVDFVGLSNTGAPSAYESDYVEKKAAAEAAVSKAEAATTAYGEAFSKVAAAKEKVAGLKDSFVSEETIRQATLAHDAAQTILWAAQSAKTAAYEKLEEARQALVTAADKIAAINERDKKAEEARAAQAVQGSGNQNGDEDPKGNTDDNGGNGGGSSDNGAASSGAGFNNAAGNGVNASIGNAVTPITTTTISTPGTLPISRRAEMSKLAQSLTDEIRKTNAASTVMAADGADLDSKVKTTDAAAKAKENVSSAFAASIPGLNTAIEDQEVALSDTAGKSINLRLLLMLLGIGAAGVAGASAELVTRSNHKESKR